MPRYLVLFLGLSVLAAMVVACEELPESVVRRNSALQGSMGWGNGFAPLPPLEQSSPAETIPANTPPALSDLPPLPFPALSPLPEPSPILPAEDPLATPAVPQGSAAPAGSPAPNAS